MIILKVFQEAFEAPTVHKISNLPIVVGRSLKCHITVNHPEISKEHIILKRSGSGYLLEDLESTNHFTHNDKTIDKLEFQQNTVIHLGSLRIEILIEEEQLEKTVEIHRKTETYRKIGVSTLIYAALMCFVYAMEFVFHSVRDIEVWDYVFAALLMSVSCFGFASLISILNRIHSGHYRLNQVLHIVFQVTLLANFFLLVDEFILFQLTHRLPQILLFSAVVISLSFYLTFRIIRLFYPDHSRYRSGIYSGSIVLYIAAAVFFSHQFSHRKDAQYRYFGFVSYPLWQGRSYETGMKLLTDDLRSSASVIEKFRLETIKKEKESELEDKKSSE